MSQARWRIVLIGTCALAALCVVGVTMCAVGQRLDPRSRARQTNLYDLGPDEPISVEQAVAFVCEPQGGVGNISPFEVQVTYRLAGLGYFGKGYCFQPSDAEKWRSLLHDEAASIYGRVCAARFLLETDDPSARAFLEEQFRSENLRHTYNAAAALTIGVGSDASKEWRIQKMIELITDDRLVSRVHTSSEMPGSWSDSPEGDFNDLVRGAFDGVCEALGELRSTSAVPALIVALERHPNRDSVARALARIGDARATPALLQALKKGGNDIGLSRALGKMKCRDAVPIIMHVLASRPESSDPFSTGDLIAALGSIGDQRAIPMLRERMAHASAAERSHIRRALAHLEHADPVPVLLGLLEEEPEVTSKVYIIWDLGRLKDARAIDSFVELVKHADDPGLRCQAIRGLGAIGTQEAVVALVGLFDVDFSALKPFIERGFPKERIEDPTTHLHAHIADQLRYVTHEELGDDADCWREWLKAQRPGESAGNRSTESRPSR